MAESRSTWRFPAPFWIANSIELFERAAYYGTFIALAVFLTQVVGFSDVEAGFIGAGFSGGIYLLPFVLGAVSDRIGFRPALILSFALLTVGYALLGLFPSKGMVVLALAVIATGGAFVKPIIGGTVSRYSDESNRARAFSLFYMVVNIGSFSGKSIAAPVRKALGIGTVPLYSAGAAFIALIVVLLLYRPKPSDAAPRSVKESLQGLGRVFSNFRFLSLVLITAGFWAIQGQLYASMPKYVLRMVGEGASPEWYANINPLVVVLLVVPVTQLVRKIKPITSIGIALGLIPFSALMMSFSSLLGREVTLLGQAIPSITLTMVLGIALQGVSECFLSPRYLEYASKQAPAGQEGLYLGYSHLNTFFAWLFGFVLSGFLLEAFCPDPKTLSAAEQAQRLAALAGTAEMPAAYAHAHYIWYAFAGVGFAGFLMLLVFQAVTRTLDKRAAAAAPQPTEGA